MSNHPLPHLLCKYATHIKNGSSVSLKCTLTNSLCGFPRYCTKDHCIKMVESYGTKCKYLLEKDGELKLTDNKQEKNVKELKTKENERSKNDKKKEYKKTEYKSKQKREVEMCRVIYVRSNAIAFDFKGYGIRMSTEHILDKDIIPDRFIEVEYESDIGKTDFKYFVKFQ